MCNTFVYTYHPTPLPAPVLQPSIVFENDNIVVDDTTNWLQISSQDLFKIIIENDAAHVHTLQAREELLSRFKNNHLFHFFPLKQTAIMLSDKYHWGIHADLSNNRIFETLMSKMKLLSPDNFKLELGNMYNLCKSRQLSKEQVVSKILIHLSAYDIKLLHKKFLNALGPRDRDDCP